MPVREPRPINMTPVQTPEPYPAEKARGGEIILNTPARRLIFFGGLIGIFVLVVALRLIAMAGA